MYRLKARREYFIGVRGPEYTAGWFRMRVEYADDGTVITHRLTVAYSPVGDNGNKTYFTGNAAAWPKYAPGRWLIRQ